MAFDLNQLMPTLQKAVSQAIQNGQYNADNSPTTQAVAQKIKQLAAPLAPLGTASLKGKDSGLLDANGNPIVMTGDTMRDLGTVVGGLDPMLGAGASELPSLADTTIGAKMAANDAKTAAKTAVNDTLDNMAAQPAGFQTGGIKLPGGSDPIDQITANKAAKNSTAYSVTTPQIKEAYARNEIKTPDDVAPAKKALYDNVVDPALQANPTRLPFDDVPATTSTPAQTGLKSKIVAEIKNMNRAISTADAENSAGRLLGNLRDAAQNEVGHFNPDGSPNVEPTDVSMKSIMDDKTALGHSVPVQSYFDGETPQTPDEYAHVATYRVLQKALEDNTSNTVLNGQTVNVPQAVKDYGLLEEGFPSYLKAHQNPVPNPLKSIAKHPIVSGAIGTVVGLGTLGGYTIVKNRDKNASEVDINKGTYPPNGTDGQGNSISNQKQDDNIDHLSTSIPQQLSDIKPQDNGAYRVIDPLNIIGPDKQPIVMTEGVFKQRYNKATQDIKALQDEVSGYQATGDTYHLPIAQGKLANAVTDRDNLTTQRTLSGAVLDQRDKTISLNNVMADAAKRLKAGANDSNFTNLLNVRGMDLDKLAQSQNPDYSELAKELQYIEQRVGGAGTIFQPGSKTATLQDNLSTANKELLNNFYTNIGTFVTGSSSAVNPPPQPAAAPTGLNAPMPTAPSPNGGYSPSTTMPPPPSILMPGR